MNPVGRSDDCCPEKFGRYKSSEYLADYIEKVKDSSHIAKIGEDIVTDTLVDSLLILRAQVDANVLTFFYRVTILPLQVIDVPLLLQEGCLFGLHFEYVEDVVISHNLALHEEHVRSLPNVRREVLHPSLINRVLDHLCEVLVALAQTWIRLYLQEIEIHLADFVE